MPYSLVSAATLGFDLVRLPAGRAVAEVLLAGLRRRRRDAGPRRRRPPRPRPGPRPARRARRPVPPGPRAGRRRPAHAQRRRRRRGGDRAAVLVAQLEQGTIGDAPDPGAAAAGRRPRARAPGRRPASTPTCSAEAADVLADAAIGYWAAGVLPPLVRRELTGPFDRRGRPRLPSPARAPTWAPPASSWPGFLDAVRDLDDAGRAALAGRRRRGPRRAPAVGRRPCTRPPGPRTSPGAPASLAAAQLHAVQAFLDGGFDRHDGAAGVWNAVAGCVQGLAMADLLDEALAGRPPRALAARHRRCRLSPRPADRIAPRVGAPSRGHVARMPSTVARRGCRQMRRNGFRDHPLSRSTGGIA